MDEESTYYYHFYMQYKLKTIVFVYKNDNLINNKYMFACTQRWLLTMLGQSMGEEILWNKYATSALMQMRVGVAVATMMGHLFLENDKKYETSLHEMIQIAFNCLMVFSHLFWSYLVCFEKVKQSLPMIRNNSSFVFSVTNSIDLFFFWFSPNVAINFLRYEITYLSQSIFFNISISTHNKVNPFNIFWYIIDFK